MNRKSEYPKNWKEIATAIKEKAGWKCERCRVPDSGKPDGNCLTVHHLVPDKSLCEDWNLAALCQRCHLKLQKVNMFQGLLGFFEYSEWFKPHLEGFLNWKCGIGEYKREKGGEQDAKKTQSIG